MLRSVLRRSFFSAVVLLVVSFLLFVLIRVLPVSPARVVLGRDATAEQIQVFERDIGLDRPLLDQYAGWVGSTLRGELGKSYVTGVSLGEELSRTFPITLELVVLAFAFAMIMALPLGIVSSLRRGGLIDHLSSVVSVLGVSIPGFWLGLMLIVFVSLPLSWFPPGGFVPLSGGVARHFLSLALPAFTLGVYYVAVLSRLTRSCMLEALSQDYVRTARAMGLGRTWIWIYALRNAAAPVVSVAAMSFGYCFGWALIIEYVFNIAGLSRALLSAIHLRDYPMIQIVVLVITGVFIAANLAADLLNELLNPTLSRESE
jgi:peptide/nickel transport system permease protein